MPGKENLIVTNKGKSGEFKKKYKPHNCRKYNNNDMTFCCLGPIRNYLALKSLAFPLGTTTCGSTFFIFRKNKNLFIGG